MIIRNRWTRHDGAIGIKDFNDTDHPTVKQIALVADNLNIYSLVSLDEALPNPSLTR